MDAARWADIESHFHRLADRSVAEQTAELARLTAVDSELADDVRAMLEADASGRTLLDRSPGLLAHALFDNRTEIPSTPFGSYRLVSLLGEGGMGVVYLGTRADLNAQAAIKVLRDAWLSPSRRERFLSEQRTLASLEHAGIARLLDADRLDDGTPWFAMEYVEGEPITSFAAGHALSLNERLQLFRQACEAVRYAHERGVIHRDIKPTNVLVNRERQVKLLDFGIAKALSGTERTIEATRTQHRLLTPAYASPEQLRGEPLGVQADVFSLGVMLFETLARQRPYDTEGLSTGEAATRIEAQGAPRVSAVSRTARDGVVSLSRLGRGAVDDLDALVACAIHPDRSRRYRSVDALLADLARYERQEPLSAQPDSVPYRFRKFMERRWREAAVAVFVLGVAATGTLAYTVNLDRARRAAEEETTRVKALRDFLVALFDGGDPAAGPSNELRVSDLLDNGVRESRARNGDPKLQAELFSVLGFASSSLGRPAQADTLFRDALALKRQHFGTHSREAIEAMTYKAHHDMALGRTHIALATLDTAYRLASEHLSRTEPVRALVTEEFGEALAGLDSTTMAIARLSEAVRLRADADTANPTYVGALSALGALADAYRDDHQFAKAESLNLAVVEKTAQMLGRDHPSVEFNLVNLGVLAERDGRYADFERYARGALALCERYFGADHTRTAAALKNLGMALVNQGKEKDALPLLRRALAIQEKVLGPNAAPVASALNALADAEVGAGDPARGIADYVRAIGIYTAMFGPTHAATLASRANLGSTLLRMERVDSAANILADVVRLSEQSVDANNHDLAIFRIRLGHARLKQKRYRDVVSQSVAGLRAMEKSSSRPTTYSIVARRDVRAAYLALGDSVRAAAYADSSALLDVRTRTPVQTSPPAKAMMPKSQ